MPTATATTDAVAPVTQEPLVIETPTEEAVAGVRAGATPGAPVTGTGSAESNDAPRLGMFIAGILAMTAGAAMFAIRKTR